MPRPLKPRQKLARQVLTNLFKLLFVVRHTLRFNRRLDFSEPAVVAVFHDEMIPMVENMRHNNMVAIASRNHNGSAVAWVTQEAGYTMVYGSQTKGGKEALFEMLGYLKQGKPVILTVDGSRGPRHEMKPGAIMLAMKAGVPLYLVRAKARGLRIPTWDRFLIPAPYSRVDMYCEEFDIAAETESIGKRDIRELTARAGTRLKAMA